MTTKDTGGSAAGMCYVASLPGVPGYCAAAVGDPRWAKETAKTISAWVREGRTVERVTDNAAKLGLNEYLAARRAARKEES